MARKAVAIELNEVLQEKYAQRRLEWFGYEVSIHDTEGLIQLAKVSVQLPIGSSGPSILDVYQREKLLSPSSFLRQADLRACGQVKRLQLL